MFSRFFLLVLLAISVSCKKDDAPGSATQLLTQKVWILSSYGYDENKNGVIDPSEENIRDCDKDNKYSFYSDGKGLYEENTLECGSGISEMTFSWRFTNGEIEIDFTTSIAKISRLAENELIIYHEAARANDQAVRYITIFRH